MEIKRRDRGKVLELEVTGHLDSSWADHLDAEITEAVRGGRHFIALNLSGVSYISSAGLRVLAKFRKLLLTLDGALTIVEPSASVREVFRATKLDRIFAAEAEAKEPQGPERVEEKRVLDLPHFRLEVFPFESGASLVCRASGDPEAFPGRAFEQKDCRPLSLPANAFAVGLGALGKDFADCRERFGELIVVCGAAAYQPTDRKCMPDYLISSEGPVSALQALYAVSCEGGFSHVLSFEAKPDRAVPLLDLAVQCLEITGADAAGMVIAAEIQGLVGAAFRRSPVLGGAEVKPFKHPEIQNWMTFTTEPAYANGVALAAGVALKNECPSLRRMVRPLGDGEWPQGHFHAAAFSYRALRKGRVGLAGTIRPLFEEEALNGVLHLLNDTRSIAGAGQSEFVRGTCWISPIATVVSERT